MYFMSDKCILVGWMGSYIVSMQSVTFFLFWSHHTKPDNAVTFNFDHPPLESVPVLAILLYCLDHLGFNLFLKS